MRIQLFILLFVGVSSCGTDGTAVSGAAIRETITAAYRRAPDQAIVLRRVVPGSWTEVSVFGPYTSAAMISQCLGESSVTTEGIERRDDIDLIVMRFRGGRIVSRAVPRGSPEFGASAVSAVYDSTATLVARPNPRREWLELAPATGLIRRCATPTSGSAAVQQR